MSKPSVFICYSRVDRTWLDQLRPFIKVALGDIELFTDRDIEPGDWWEQRIREQIGQADIVIFLLSIDSLTSDFIRRVEIPLFQRFQRERGLRIIPILLRSCPYIHYPWVKDLQVWRPEDGRALTERENIELEMNKIVDRLVKIVQPTPGSQTVPERTDWAGTAPSSRSEAEQVESWYSGPTELRPSVDPAPLRAAVRIDRAQPAPSWHSLPDQPYVQSIRLVGSEPQPGSGERALARQPGTSGLQGPETTNGPTLELDEATAKWLERARPDELDERRLKLAELVSQNPDDAQSHFILAMLLARQGKLDDALVHLDHVIRLAPGSPLGWTTRGDVRASRRDLEGALADFCRATAIASGDLPGYRGQGDMLRRLGRLDEAKVAYGQALERAPDDADARFGLALTLQEQGDSAEALSHLDRVIALAPESPIGWAARGDVRASDQDFEGALADFHQATEADPNASVGYWRQADMLRRLGRLDEAKAAYAQALERAPDDADVHFGLALTLQEQGDTAEALGHLDRVIALAPESPAGWGTRGDVRASGQDFEGALADFRRATEAKPDASVGYRGQGDILRIRGRPIEAEAAYGQALKRDPDDAQAHFGLALTLQAQGNSAGALGHLDRVVALAPESLVVWRIRGEVLVSLRAYDRAVDAIDHALKLAPTDADLWIQRGDTLRIWAEELEDLEPRPAALAAIEEALRHDAGSAEAMAVSGALKGSLERFEDALADLNSSLDRKPDFEWAIKEKGKVLLRAGNLGEALDVFVRLAGSAEDKLDAIAGKALCLRRLGRSSECENELSRIDSGSPDDAKKFVEIARAFEDYKAHDDAIGMFGRAIARSPALADAHNEIAWCRAEHLGQGLKESTAHAQLAVSLSTDERTKGNYLDTLGWIWFKRGALDEAKRFLDEAVGLREADLLIRRHHASVERAIAMTRCSHFAE